MCLKVEKCKFAFSEVLFLGHIVGREGLKMDPKKVQAISNIAYPTSKKEVSSCLRMVGYYINFIPDFAGIGKTLFDTLKDTQAEIFSTSEEVKQAVDKLKSTLSAYPVLQFPNFNEPFMLEIDASTI